MNVSPRYFAFMAVALFFAGCASLQPPPSRNQAVMSLLDQAHAYSNSGELGQAGASLERALRIEPRNPQLWQELARIRLDQGQYRQAENLAKKSNALGTDDSGLQRENWLLISQARSLRGDPQGAQTARDRAAER